MPVRDRRGDVETGAPIDFVVTYLDPADPKWREDRRRFSTEGLAWGEANGDERYRSMDNFQYWFRAVERYAPWVRTVFLVTQGHVPGWLNLGHPKLRVVRHDEFMDPRVLPVFNSNSIELSMDQIDGLSEQFVEFNDDVFLNNPVGPEHFFVKGRPRIDCMCATPLPSTDFNMVMFNNMRVINQVAKPNLRFYLNALSPKNGILEALYGATLLPTIILSGKFVGFRALHTPHPLRKSALRWLKGQVPRPYARTIATRFREYEDVNIWSVLDYMRATGYIEVCPMVAENIMVKLMPESDYEALLRSRYKVICLEDSPDTVDFSDQVARLNSALARKFPTKSTFEE